MRKLASIQTITEITPIENSDTLSLAKILAWKSVIKRDDYNVGDKVIYMEIDSFLPIRPEYEFLRKSCYRMMIDGSEGFRIKTAMLRGQLSQGLIMPMSILPPGDYKEGDDVTEILGVTKYQTDIPVSLVGEMKGNFPNFILKTDEDRVQGLQRTLNEYAGTRMVVTEKVDGTSATFYLRDGEYGVCSREIEYLPDADNDYIACSKRLGIEDKLKKLGRNIAIQGEIFGKGWKGNAINGNNLKMDGMNFAVFNIYDIDAGEYYDYQKFIETLELLDLQPVPILDDCYTLGTDIDAILEYAKGKSALNRDRRREGVVFKSFENVKGFGKLSFKAISNEYLLKVEQ